MARLDGKIAFITGAGTGIEPEDIAQCALYLAADDSRMVTGQIIPVDSGVTIS